jgi:hypothetical protein
MARLKDTLGSDKSKKPKPNYMIGQPEGLLKPGNIDLNNRPIVRNADGSSSTEYSVSFNHRGREVLVPTVVNGKFLTKDGKKPPVGTPAEKAMFKRAFDQYKKTGQHLGMFSSPEHADTYAKTVHSRFDPKVPEKSPFPMQKVLTPRDIVGAIGALGRQAKALVTDPSMSEVDPRPRSERVITIPDLSDPKFGDSPKIPTPSVPSSLKP